MIAAPSPPRRFAAWRVEAFFSSSTLMLWPLQVATTSANVKSRMTCVHFLGNHSNPVQPSIRHCDLLPSYRGRSQPILTQADPISKPDAVCYSVPFLSPTYQITTAKVYVISDSVLCMSERRGEEQNYMVFADTHFKELNRIDGMETEFEWKIFPGLTTLGLLEKIQNLMKDLQCESEQVNDRIIFVSMFLSMCKDIVWREEGNTEKRVTNSVVVSKYARGFPCVRWSFLGFGSEQKWYTNCFDKPEGNWDRTSEMMILQLTTESGHPIFRASSTFERLNLRSNKHGKKSTHFNESEGNIELLLRTVISVNQLSIYGALADLCKELNKNSKEDSAEDSFEDSESSGTLYAKEKLKMRQLHRD